MYVFLPPFSPFSNPESKKSNGQHGEGVKPKRKQHQTEKVSHSSRTRPNGSARSKTTTMRVSIISCMFSKTTIGRPRRNKIGAVAQTFSSYIYSKYAIHQTASNKIHICYVDDKRLLRMARPHTKLCPVYKCFDSTLDFIRIYLFNCLFSFGLSGNFVIRYAHTDLNIAIFRT